MPTWTINYWLSRDPVIYSSQGGLGVLASVGKLLHALHPGILAVLVGGVTEEDKNGINKLIKRTRLGLT